MVVYSSPYADSFDSIPKTKQKKIWDAVEVLDIINPDRGCLTCVGYAPSCRRRCRNPINAGNRATAFRLLDRIAYSKPQSPDTRKLLHELAKCALCLRNHQDQAHDVVAQWERKIAAMTPEQKVKTEPFDDNLSELMKKLAKIRAERDRQAQEKEEKARRATEERDRKDRQRREQQEKEEKAERAREAEGRRERERKRREEQERQNAQRETKRWHERWNTYISRWDEFSSEFPRPRIIRF